MLRGLCQPLSLHLVNELILMKASYRGNYEIPQLQWKIH
jgi:hypothetical protein